ncbi:restriction endonuclease subunit S [Marinomonas sp.]
MTQTYKLSDLADIKSGYTFRGKIEEVLEGTAYIVQPKEFRYTKEVKIQDNIEVKDLPQIVWEGRPSAFIDQECVLLPIRGEYREALYVSESDLGIGLPIIASAQFAVIYPKSTILTAYLCWVLGQTDCQNYLSQAGEGSVIKTLKLSDISDMPIYLPTKKVQEQLVNLHKCWQKERKLTQKLLDNREQMLKGIYQQILKEEQL